MARIRTIKPEFPQSESMGRVSRDARLLFIEIWTICDDAGRTRAASRMLASLLFPYDDDAPSLIDGWLKELEAEGCIVRYAVDGSTYLQVCNWLSHQKIDKPSQSKIPNLDETSRILSNPREESSEDQGPRTKDQGEDQDLSASDDAGHADKPVYLTKKKRQLTGKQLEAFEQFWETFAYPKGKAEAADAWIDLKVTQSLLPAILGGAKREAARRAVVLAKGGSPKWAQGWLSGRRWEDGEEVTGAGGDEKPWYQRADGIEAKGDELGIEKGPDESFPAFKARVLQAAGVSA